MSLSNQKSGQSSPVEKWYNWSGAEGHLSYYDKESGTKKQVQSPFVFIPIDHKACVEGYSAKHEMGFRSNEVTSTAKEELEVKWNNGKTIVKGLYANIKDGLEKIGGKYHRSIYGIQQIDGQWKLINIRFKGAAMSAYLNLDKSIKQSLEGLTITITKSEEKKTGNVKYFEPVFKVEPTDEATAKIAFETDIMLQEYFKNRNSWSEETNLGENVDTSEPTAEELAELKRAKKANSSKTKAESAPINEVSQEDFFDDFN